MRSPLLCVVAVFLSGCTVLDLTRDTATEAFEFTAIERDVHDQINAYRESLGLPPLEADPTIGEASRAHSQGMLDLVVGFGHDRFAGRIDTIGEVLDISSAGENVAYNIGYDDPATMAVQGWIDSPPHHENIVGTYGLAGVGIARGAEKTYYFTQIFVLEF